jgi:hypothetical protein
MNYGFVPSKMDGTEKKFVAVEGLDLPESYSYVNFLPPILNQGERPICVPCSISAHLNWNKNVDTDGDNKRDNNVKLLDIYASRTTGGDNGMTFKDALKYIKHNGVRSDAGVLKIDKYALVGGALQIKQALLLNGPLVGALPVYSTDKYFWRDEGYSSFMGGHAISIVGYDKNGLIIGNSWGTSFGDNGYTHINWDELRTFKEMWTIID